MERKIVLQPQLLHAFAYAAAAMAAAIGTVSEVQPSYSMPARALIAILFALLGWVQWQLATSRLVLGDDYLENLGPFFRTRIPVGLIAGARVRPSGTIAIHVRDHRPIVPVIYQSGLLGAFVVRKQRIAVRAVIQEWLDGRQSRNDESAPGESKLAYRARLGLGALLAYYVYFLVVAIIARYS